MNDRTELNRVFCSNCANFIIGNGQGFGECKVMNNYLAENHQPAKDVQMFAKLGNKHFWAGTDKRNKRFCPEFSEAATYPFVHGD